MIISPPYLLPRNANETDEAWINRCMPGGQPGGGAYPLSHAMQWHGGIHLTEPEANAPVRAIADGDVVFLRRPNPQPPGPLPDNHAQTYMGGWTDNGVVVLKHTTEIGEGANASVTFFSIYMHLREIDATVQDRRRIYRKAAIGRAGQVYGQTGRLHFEIVCDDTHLQRLAGRASGALNTGANGRTDAVYGSMHFRLPAGTPVYGEQPMLNNPVAHRQPPRPAGAARNAPMPAPVALQATHTTAQDLFVGLRHAAGEGAAANRGDAYLSTYQTDGVRIGEPLPEHDAEYNLYTRATTISSAYPANAQPAPSAVYELLRFGRVIGPDPLNPANVPHWRQIRYPGGTGWVNLNAGNVNKFSDADFPHWMGWSLVDDSADQDSRCDSATIKAWLDVNGDGKVAPAEALARMNTAAVAPKLARAVCKFPTEWNAASFDRRLSWIKTSTAENPTPVDAANFKRLGEHIAALAFWPGNTGLDESHWHWNPRAFIGHFRKCSWLSSDDLSRIYPDSVYPIRALAQIGRTPAGIRDQYRNDINKVARKHFVVTSSRLTHFFGQGAVESLNLALMIEGSANFTRNPAHASYASEANGYYNPPAGGYLDYLNGRLGNIDAGDGPKFRGRGMKQLTGRENYSKYWVYRGWLDKDSFTSPWWNPARPARAPQIPNPQVLSTNDHNAIDAGGWYWEAGSTANRFRSINISINQNSFSDAAIEAVTRAINGGVTGLPERITQTNRIRPILTDEV